MHARGSPASRGVAHPDRLPATGHANPAITMAIYAHALTDFHGDEMQTPAAFAFAGAV
jgi:hypothetical protein